MPEICNVPSTRCSDASIVRSRLTRVRWWKSHNAHTPVASRHLVERVVCHPVPDNQEFKIREGLFKGRLDRWHDMPAPIEGCDHDGEERRIRHRVEEREWVGVK